MEYHYESHTTTRTILADGDRHSETTSSVLVRELDDGEVGILLAGNNSIFDPTLTPHMLSPPITDYNVESDAPSTLEDDGNDHFEDDDEDDTWFPSLRRFSSIHGLSDEENTSTEQPSMETLIATDIVEQDASSEEEPHKKKRKGQRQQRHRKKSRRISKELGNEDDKSSGDDSDHIHIDFVPIDVVCVCIE